VKDLADAAIDAADTRPGVGFQDNFVARPGLGFIPNPGGYAACSIPGYFGDGAVGIVQADRALAFRSPGKELYAIGSDAGVAVAQPARQAVSGLNACEILLNDEKVVSTGMRLYKRDHSASAS
jgi:hypothetical protein